MTQHLESPRHPYTVLHDFESTPTDALCADWPLHITLVPPFALSAEIEEAEVLDIVRGAALETGPFNIEPGEQAKFGPGLDIPGTRIVDTQGSLQRLHTTLLRRLGTSGCVFMSLAYAGDYYSPHVSHTSTMNPPSESYTCRSISIFRQLPNIVNRKALVIEKIII